MLHNNSKYTAAGTSIPNEIHVILDVSMYGHNELATFSYYLGDKKRKTITNMKNTFLSSTTLMRLSLFLCVFPYSHFQL